VGGRGSRRKPLFWLNNTQRGEVYRVKELLPDGETSSKNKTRCRKVRGEKIPRLEKCQRRVRPVVCWNHAVMILKGGEGGKEVCRGKETEGESSRTDKASQDTPQKKRENRSYKEGTKIYEGPKSWSSLCSMQRKRGGKTQI